MNTKKLISLLAALSLTVAHAWATDYTTPQYIDGETKTYEPGDTITILPGAGVANGLNIVSNATVSADNIVITMGTENTPYEEREFNTVNVATGSIMNVGSNTEINGYGRISAGVQVVQDSTFSAVSGLKINATDTRDLIGNGILVLYNSHADLGTGASISANYAIVLGRGEIGS